MRNAKKIVWVILALLPILPVIFTIIAHNGNQTADTTMPMGTITIQSSSSNSAYLEIKPNTWAHMIFSSFDPYPNSINAKGLLCTTARFMLFLKDNCGIPVSAPLFIGFWYLSYLAILELCSILIDLIMFVPRKCLELFQ